MYVAVVGALVIIGGRSKSVRKAVTKSTSRTTFNSGESQFAKLTFDSGKEEREYRNPLFAGLPSNKVCIEYWRRKRTN